MLGAGFLLDKNETKIISFGYFGYKERIYFSSENE